MGEESSNSFWWLGMTKAVMDAAWSEVGGADDRQKSVAVQAAMKDIAGHYECSLKWGGPRFDNASRRMAYCALHLVPRSRCLFDVLENEQDYFAHLLSNNSLVVWSIGGGPGSDIIGLLRRWRQWGMKPFLRCQNLDREDGWRKVNEGLQTALQEEDWDASIAFISQTEKQDEKVQTAVEAPQVVLLSNILSEIYFKKDDKNYEETVMSILMAPEPGSLLVVVDVAHWDFCEWSRKLLLKCGYICKDGYTKSDVKMERGEWEQALGNYRTLLDLSDPRPYKVDFGLWQRGSRGVSPRTGAIR